MDTQVKQNDGLYPWAKDLVTLYESGASSQFILYGNIHDNMLVPHDEALRLSSLFDYLMRVLMKPFDVVLSYDIGNGIRVEKGGDKFSTWPATKELPEFPKEPRKAVTLLTHYFRYAANLASLGREAPHIGCVINAADMVLPAVDTGYSYDLSTISLLVREWANDPVINNHAIATFLLVENLNDLQPLISGNIRAGKIKVPLPDTGTIQSAIEVMGPGFSEILGKYKSDLRGFSEQLTGVMLCAVEQLLKTSLYRKEPVQPDKLVHLKRDMVEKDYGGLISFIETDKTLDRIYGNEKIKEWLRQDIALWEKNDLKAMPMGYLLCGPVGTGKTFFVECLAGEAGVPVVKLKNFRDKWVGSTEGNLEKIFRLLHALGRCIVFIDEADQSLGRRVTTSGDSNVSGRVYSMIAEEMSDTDNRGKILWVLASSRPDLIEVDLKRPGRIDVKIPLFPTTTPEEGFALIRALCGRLDMDIPETLFGELKDSIPVMLTPGAAEALAVKIYRISRTRGISEVEALKQSLSSYQIPVPKDIMEFQIDIAVREASDLEFVPASLRKRKDIAQ